MEVDCALGLGGCSSGRDKDESFLGLFDNASRPTLLHECSVRSRGIGPVHVCWRIAEHHLKGGPLRRLPAGMFLLPVWRGKGCLLLCGASACASLSKAEQQARTAEHTSELQSLMRISYTVLCLKKEKMSINHN